jgi:serine/threonine-protein kinase RsbW
MTGDRISIILPCDLRYRDAVGAMIQQVCQRLEHEGAEPGLGHQVLSAFNEAFNNLSLHGPESSPAALEVDLQLTAEQLAIEIRDEGDPFDYTEVAPPDLDELPESGLGIFIMRSFMSEVHYLPRADGAGKNRLRMVRDLKA